MQICTVVKLNTSPEQHQALLATLQTCNAVCNQISQIAFETGVFRKYDLHHLVYHNIRHETKLPAGHVICSIAKVANAYMLDTDTRRSFYPLGAIEFNADTLSWRTEQQSVSLKTTSGRIRLPYPCSSQQKALLETIKGQADLIYRKGQFYLSVAIKVSEPEAFVPEGVIGVDLGIVNIATDSQGHRYTGETVQKARKKHRRRRQQLQAKKTRSARKKLAMSRRKESRFVRDVNHCVSKSLDCTMPLSLSRVRHRHNPEPSFLRNRRRECPRPP